ncbi:ethanolamine utilization microcompartment protein EutL [Bacillota bacterium Meth-B3]
MKGDLLRAKLLSARIIPRADEALRAQLGLQEGERSLALITCDSDDVGYTALDEATKAACVRVCYAQSMYAGAANMNTALAGEFLGILAGPTPAEARSALQAARACIEQGPAFVSANDGDTVVYYAHTIARTGSYLSALCGLSEGAPLAYLIAPPLESIVGLDAALKAAGVRMAQFYGPPSPTNFGGALLTGPMADCLAACRAFAEAVERVAARPIEEA